MRHHERSAAEECTDPRIGAQQRADECEPQPLWRGVDLDELGEVLCLCTDIGTSLRNAGGENFVMRYRKSFPQIG